MTSPSPAVTPRRGYTIDEASALYRLSRSTLYLELQSGHLKSIKIGKSRRILPENLNAWESGLAAKPQGGAA